MTQTLSSGLTSAQKLGLTLGFSDEASGKPEPLAGTIGLLKYGGAGGSHFSQSIPGAFILNADHTPVVHNPLRATMWPFVLNNRALEPDPAYPGDISKARNIKMVWDKPFSEAGDNMGVMGKVAQLVELAAQNKPRPTAVVIDTVDAMVDCIQPWLAQRFNKAEFADLGETGWTRRISQFFDRLYWPLRWAGYPIILIIQIYDEPITVPGPGGQGHATKIIPNTPLLSEKFAKRLRDICNVVAKIEPYEEAGGEMVNGKWINAKKRGWRMVFRDPVMENVDSNERVLKARVGLPDWIDITGNDPWQKYATAFEAAANRTAE